MKKIVVVFLFLSLIAGCNKKVEENKPEKIEPLKEETTIPQEEKYIDNNPIKLSFYMFLGNNTGRKKLTEYKTSFAEGNDLCSLEIYYSQDEILSIDTQKNLWNKYISEYNDIGNYRIGYKISFSTVNGEKISKYILSPSDTDSIFNYIQLYLYDDIHVADGVWYSHVTPEQYNDNTILTSIKLTGSYDTKDVASDFYLDVFTYDSDDFDENHEYRGNSKASIVISRS